MAQITTQDAIAKPLLRMKPIKEDYERYLQSLDSLEKKLNHDKDEEHNKAYVKEFLLDAYYRGHNEINTCDDIDWAIFSGDTDAFPVDVIIEAKTPSNKSEFPSLHNLNCKGMQETVLYFMRQRCEKHNITLKHIVITNGYEWFIFDASEYERYFYQDSHFRNTFIEYNSNQTLFSQTSYFYKDIAKPQIDKIKNEIKYVYFDIRTLNSEHKKMLIYKLLSPQHLLKQYQYTDSNSLDKGFYNELLYIIGLEEVKENNKLVIKRQAEGRRNDNSLLESTLYQLEIKNVEDKNRFEIALNLVITWVNRILFLKLLESQLISYHPKKNVNDFQVLYVNKIKDYDELNELFFMVLAKPEAERNSRVRDKFCNVPYLNSSLFEMTDTEDRYFCIGQLKKGTMPLFKQTILKDIHGKRMQMEMDTLEYLFRFMDAYDFGIEATDSMTSEESRTLINASVLGLIFEKINGYKDGSFFTPGIITQYMCHETITRAVLQKLNEQKGWHCEDMEQLYDKIENRQEANEIINSLTICDPAVGSGHFLVSALNEMIAVKSRLRVLQDKEGKRLKEWDITVDNDELCIFNDEGEFFHYNPSSVDSQRVQETLFNEKRYLIEHCLFGVDLNPNSVNICRLRLWIELLKNAYYRKDGNLETLPNIDINIKCGDSLCAKYPIDCDITPALNTAHITVVDYRQKIDSYRNAKSKEDKFALEKVIKDIKENIKSSLRTSDPIYVLLNRKKQEYYNKYEETLMELSLSNADRKRKKKLEDEIAKYQKEVDDIKNNKLYEKALEWRFEFPEVLDENGKFVGFDIVIGNPPYIRRTWLDEKCKKHYEKNYVSAQKQYDIYLLFIERGCQLVKDNGRLCYINPIRFFNAEYGQGCRKFIMDNLSILSIIDISQLPVFENAQTYPGIFLFSRKSRENNEIGYIQLDNLDKLNTLSTTNLRRIPQSKFDTPPEYKFIIPCEEETNPIITKIESSKNSISTYYHCSRGLSNNKIDTTKKDYQAIKSTNTRRYYINGGIQIGTAYADKFRDEMVVLPRTVPNLQATIKPKNIIVLDRIYYLIPKSDKHINSLFVLGILNSKISNYWFEYNYGSSKVRGGYFDLNSPQIMSIPIPNCDNQQPIIDLVEKILAAKKVDPNANTKDWEEDIDKCVYDLYGLTEPEKEIIEKM